MLIFVGVVAVALAVGLAAMVWERRRIISRVRRLDRALSGRKGERDPSPDTTLSRIEREVARRLADEAAEWRSEERLRLALDGITQGIVVCDAEGEIVVRNAYAETFVNARHGEVLVGDAITDVLLAARQGEAGEQEVEIFGPPARSYFVHGFPVGDGDGGELLGALAVIEDTTEARRVEAVRRDFVANLSHEVKTPIGALSLLAETLVGERDPGNVDRLTGRLQLEVDRLARMVDDLLVLSRIEHAGMVELDQFGAERVVEEAVDRSRPILEQRGIRVVTDGVSTGISVAGDRRQLVSAVANLLDNAAKYSDEDAQVEVRLVADDEMVSFVVQDHGIGIPGRDLDRIFERFYRVDRARSRATGGTGLGLSIVRHVAANHGGDVQVESREGQGSTFTLKVPRTQATMVEEVSA